eukprot:1055296-Rhodomonas_salina.1
MLHIAARHGIRYAVSGLDSCSHVRAAQAVSGPDIAKRELCQYRMPHSTCCAGTQTSYLCTGHRIANA